MFLPILISTISLLGCSALFGLATNTDAPGAPGLDSHWPSAAKNGFGTANTLRSKVWFTLNDGVMTEVYYPRSEEHTSELQSQSNLVCRLLLEIKHGSS